MVVGALALSGTELNQSPGDLVSQHEAGGTPRPGTALSPVPVLPQVTEWHEPADLLCERQWQ